MTVCCVFQQRWEIVYASAFTWSKLFVYLFCRVVSSQQLLWTILTTTPARLQQKIRCMELLDTTSFLCWWRSGSWRCYHQRQWYLKGCYSPTTFLHWCTTRYQCEEDSYTSYQCDLPEKNQLQETHGRGVQMAREHKKCSWRCWEHRELIMGCISCQ